MTLGDEQGQKSAQELASGHKDDDNSKALSEMRLSLKMRCFLKVLN
jgi:hypothetical protein